jgi:hypothetical protein
MIFFVARDYAMIFFVAQEHRIIGQSAAPPLLLVLNLCIAMTRCLDLKLKVPGCLPQIHGTLQEAAVSIYFYPKWWTMPSAIRRRIWGVFDFSALHGLAGKPGSGQPQPGCRVQLLLFDLIVPNDPSYAAVVLPPILFPCSLLRGISSNTCMVTRGRRTRKLHRGRRAATGKQIRIPSLVRLPPTRLSACRVSLFGYVHIQSQARESRRLVACTR